MRFKAVFFDRDGTLTHGNPEKRRWLHEAVERWSGQPFELPYEKMMGIFRLAGYDQVRSVATEKGFWRRYYRCLLEGEGVRNALAARSEELFRELWCENNPPIPYPETFEVLEFFKSRGYKMGVISDTSPSLELSLQMAGLAEYFTSFTASSLVGAEKPSPIIFNAALAAQGITAAESLYVDDYDVEADGAREQGFTSFLIDRDGLHSGEWVIQSLQEMADYVEGLRS